MDQTVSVWLVLGAALIAANLPFVNERWFALVRLGERKSLWARLLELLLLYLLVGGLGLALEQRAGQIYPQGWEFYATTLALFATLAFPGFVYRYLYKKRHG
ncbi:MAG: DUF2818 family protein [Hydrogenophaga sp.]|uniref:DUF2818 family protein n=1 Tax=Hydrogenophaga sp. TaxID=1904254 RepID=UPI001DE0A7FC|nr:DUF2818 family protein [Hydrogenophaga sp.]MBX3611018.1 DUF2818 family protein [Hydrogenophaga sp.]